MANKTVTEITEHSKVTINFIRVFPAIEYPKFFHIISEGSGACFIFNGLPLV